MEKSGKKGPLQGQQTYNAITAFIICRGPASFSLHFIHCLQAALDGIKMKLWEQPHTLQLPQRGHSLWSHSFCGQCLICNYWTVSQCLPAKTPLCCSVKLLHLHWASPYLHNKWDIPKHNIFMLYLKTPAHYHSSNLSIRKWIPHLHGVEMWELIVKLQMDHWEPKCVEDCSAKIKPLISAEKRFIILVSLSQFRDLLVIASWSSICKKKVYSNVCECATALSTKIMAWARVEFIHIYAYLCVYVCV